jgi:SNF2 family DNA or RNA helicase
MIAQLPDDGGELPVISALALMTRLSQLASAAADVWTEPATHMVTDPMTGDRYEEEYEQIHVRLKAPSWKVDELLDVLAERPGKQVAVFSPSRQLLEVAGPILAKAGHRVGYIVGGQTPAQRTADIDAFQAGHTDVILVSTKAGGVGITLTAASVEVFLQRPWSFVEASQAEDRCHRIGSEIHESIEIIDIVAKDTVESRVREVLKVKAGALSELLEDPRIQREVLGGLPA